MQGAKMKMGVAAAALAALTACAAPAPSAVPQGSVAPVSAAPSPTGTPDRNGPPGPGLLVLFKDGQRTSSDSIDGEALNALTPQVRDRVLAVFAKHGVTVVASHEAGSGYIAIQAPRATSEEAMRAIADDIRSDAAVLAAEPDLRQAPAS